MQPIPRNGASNLKLKISYLKKVENTSMSQNVYIFKTIDVTNTFFSIFGKRRKFCLRVVKL